jgi:uroporphyrinogen decarboxylase
VDCGIDGLNPIESTAGMMVKELRKRYPELVLLGGVDCSEILPYSDDAFIRKITRECIENAQYGYFPGSTSEIHNEIPLDNYLSFYQEVTHDVH